MNTNKASDKIKALSGSEREAALLVVSLIRHKTGSHMCNINSGLNNIEKGHSCDEARLSRLKHDVKAISDTINEVSGLLSD